MGSNETKGVRFVPQTSTTHNVERLATRRQVRDMPSDELQPQWSLQEYVASRSLCRRNLELMKPSRAALAMSRRVLLRYGASDRQLAHPQGRLQAPRGQEGRLEFFIESVPLPSSPRTLSKLMRVPC